jgi:hypothetical protein
MTDSSLDTKPVYWLKGVAGTGKTAVAQSVAMIAAKKGLLGASFFFSRTSQDAERRRATAVIPTIAYQLAVKHERFRSKVCEAVSSEPDVRNTNLQTQAKLFLSPDVPTNISHPLPLPLLVVIDALDECDEQNRDEADGLVSVLVSLLQSLPFVKILITSRPERSIEITFAHPNISSAWTQFALHRDIEESVVRSDIHHYLQVELGWTPQLTEVQVSMVHSTVSICRSSKMRAVLRKLSNKTLPV